MHFDHSFLGKPRESLMKFDHSMGSPLIWSFWSKYRSKYRYWLNGTHGYLAIDGNPHEWTPQWNLSFLVALKIEFWSIGRAICGPLRVLVDTSSGKKRSNKERLFTTPNRANKERTGLVFLVDGQYRFGGLALLIMHILYICHYAFKIWSNKRTKGRGLLWCALFLFLILQIWSNRDKNQKIEIPLVPFIARTAHNAPLLFVHFQWFSLLGGSTRGAATIFLPACRS